MAEFSIISYLATIAFAAKQDKYFDSPGKIFPRICVVAMLGTIASPFLHISFILSIHNSNKLYPSILPLCMIRGCLIA
jgi:hypothetical protein